VNLKYYEKGDAKIAAKILRSLPDWFALDEATQNYIDESKELPMMACFQNDDPVGFLSTKHHSPYTAEIYVMGIEPKHHRKSHGSRLIAESENKLRSQGIDFLQVKTLSEDRECEFYRKTRLFYKAQGFKEVEVFPTLWGAANPCLLMIKSTL
jgi:ribosomal protein S18 acetylase RimI-like enzyme